MTYGAKTRNEHSDYYWGRLRKEFRYLDYSWPQPTLFTEEHEVSRTKGIEEFRQLFEREFRIKEVLTRKSDSN